MASNAKKAPRPVKQRGDTRLEWRDGESLCVCNKNKHKTTFSNHKRKKSRTNYWPTLHATMEMTEYLKDKILSLCGIISEKTRTITLRILYHLKLAPTHPLIPESAKADLLPSTLLIGTVTDSPWVTTSSTINIPHTTRKKRNLFFPPRFRASTGVHCQTTHPSPLHATLHPT